MSTIAYTCEYCGWSLTWEALRENGGVAYCCASKEEDTVRNRL